MAGPFRVIEGIAFRSYRIVNPGENLFVIAGGRVAVETWALDWGRHEFDYELNSRGLDARGRPGAIATTRSSLTNEFIERRAVSRQPIPISVAANGLTRAPDVAMTLGEVRPQVYTSRLHGPRWRGRLRSARTSTTERSVVSARHRGGRYGTRRRRGAAGLVDSLPASTT